MKSLSEVAKIIFFGSDNQLRTNDTLNNDVIVKKKKKKKKKKTTKSSD